MCNLKHKYKLQRVNRNEKSFLNLEFKRTKVFGGENYKQVKSSNGIDL